MSEAPEQDGFSVPEDREAVPPPEPEPWHAPGWAWWLLVLATTAWTLLALMARCSPP